MPSSWKSVIVGSQDGQTVQVAHSWRTEATNTAAHAQSIADEIGTEWGSNIVSNLVDDYSFTHVDVVNVEDPTIGATSTTGATSGEITAQPLPIFVVARVKLTTGLRGRSFQGRWGIPGLQVSMLDADDANFLDPDVQGGLQTLVGLFYSGMASAGVPVTPAVISTIHGGTPRPSPLVTEVTTVTVERPLGTRVSRKD